MDDISDGVVIHDQEIRFRSVPERLFLREAGKVDEVCAVADRITSDLLVVRVSSTFSIETQLAAAAKMAADLCDMLHPAKRLLQQNGLTFHEGLGGVPELDDPVD